MKKSIKKRSLMSAVAMLVVSAIVLTSATFAWFSLSNNAKVNQFDVSVQAASGVRLSLDGGTNYYSIITNEILEKALTKKLTEINLMPVDWNGTAFRTSTSTEGDVLVLGAATANTHYVEFNLTIEVGAPGVVNFTQGAGLDSSIGGTASSLAYVSLDNKIYADDLNAGYSSINADKTGGTLVSGIVTDATAVTAMTINQGIKNFSLTFAAAGSQTVKVAAWVEGQDANCAGSYAGGTLSVALNLGFVPA